MADSGSWNECIGDDGLSVTVRDIGKLFGKGRGEFSCDAAVRPEERQIFADGFKAEIGVQLRADDGAIFSGSEDDQETFGSQIRGGKVPGVLVRGAVGQRPASEINVGGLSVVNLDPIAELAVFVGESVFVVGHELADDDLSWGGNCEQSEREDQKDLLGTSTKTGWKHVGQRRY